MVGKFLALTYTQLLSPSSPWPRRVTVHCCPLRLDGAKRHVVAKGEELGERERGRLE